MSDPEVASPTEASSASAVAASSSTPGPAVTVAAADPKADPEALSEAEPEENAASGLTPEERAKKAAARRKKKQERAKRKKAEAAAAATNNVFSASATTIAALEASFPAHPMHSYFTPEGNGTKFVFNRRQGRFVVAARPIPSGTPIFRMQPYGSVVTDAFVHAFCHRCLQTSERMFVCQSCGHARFCSTKCRDAMADIHTRECAALKRLQSTKMEGESAAIRLMIRICYQYQQEKSLEAAAANAAAAATSKLAKAKALKQYQPAPGMTFADSWALISHAESYDPSQKTSILLLINQLQQKVIQDDNLWKSTEIDIDTCMRILLQIQCNAHHITDANKDRIGLGLYIPACYHNHSCKPNCRYYFDEGKTMVMQSIRRISEGEEITYSYVDLYQSRADRHQILKSVYFVDECLCEKCSVDEKQSSDILMRSFVCSSCGANPLRRWREANNSGGGEAQPASMPLAVLELDHSNGASCPSCKKSYKSSALSGMVDDTRLLMERAVLMSQSGDTADAIDFLASRVLYPEAASTSGQPFFHPYHASMFNTYLLLLNFYVAASKPIPAIHLAKAILECMHAQQMNAHPEYADTLKTIGDMWALLNKQRVEKDENENEKEKAKEQNEDKEAKKEQNILRTAPLIPKQIASENADAAAAGIAAMSVSKESTSSSASSSVASSSSSSSSTFTSLDPVDEAYLSYSSALSIRLNCYGRTHPRTREVAHLAQLYKEAKQETTTAASKTKAGKDKKKKK